MGILTCAIAVRSEDKAGVLTALRLKDTGRICPDERVPFGRSNKRVLAALPDGWLYFLGDFWKLDERRLRDASRLGLVVTCSVATVVDASQARAFEDGNELWFVNRDPDSYPEYDPHQLEVRGDLPPVFRALCDRYFPIMSDPGAEEDEGDIFEIPLELAKAVCGYRPDYVLPDCVFSYVERTPDPRPTTPFLHRLAKGLRMAGRAFAESRASRR